MKKRIYLYLVLISLLSVSGCVWGAPIAANATVTIQPAATAAEPTMAAVPTHQFPPAPDGWLTYINDSYGFYFHYPSQFEVLTDADSLNGWEKAVLLLYTGGQSYDVAVQVWDSLEEMEAFYGGEEERLHVYPLGAQILSVMSITNEAESDAIIESFTIYQ